MGSSVHDVYSLNGLLGAAEGVVASETWDGAAAGAPSSPTPTARGSTTPASTSRDVRGVPGRPGLLRGPDGG